MLEADSYDAHVLKQGVGEGVAGARSGSRASALLPEG